MGRVSRGSPVQTAMRNCARDEGRSFEAGSQVLASNRCKLLSSKAMVVSVAVNVGRISRRVRLREASASEPPMNCRKRIRRCQTRGVTLPPGSARGNPEACPSGIRCGVRDCGCDLGLGRSARNDPRTARRSLETVHFGPEYCVASLPLRRTANGDMEMNAQATNLQAAENDLKQLMADVTRAWEKAQEAVARRPSKGGGRHSRDWIHDFVALERALMICGPLSKA